MQSSAITSSPECKIILTTFQQTTDLLQTNGRQTVPAAQCKQRTCRQTSMPTHQTLALPTDMFGSSQETARPMEMSLIETMRVAELSYALKRKTFETHKCPKLEA
uniref:Uncharacterized protein n=1 Tax=Peronospora matthiolae TaxID=2874970 RepID=A0AAV1T727_9STRA